MVRETIPQPNNSLCLQSSTLLKCPWARYWNLPVPGVQLCRWAWLLTTRENRFSIQETTYSKFCFWTEIFRVIMETMWDAIAKLSSETKMDSKVLSKEEFQTLEIPFTTQYTHSFWEQGHFYGLSECCSRFSNLFGGKLQLSIRVMQFCHGQ